MSTKFTGIQQEIIKLYLDYVEKHGKHPTREQMSKLGYSNNKIRHHFTSLKNLRSEVKRLHPKVFESIIDEDFFTKKKFKELEGEIAKYKKFVITTAVNGCKVDKDFLKSLETYCKENKAALLILPSNDPAHNLDNAHRWNFDSILADKLLVFGDLKLNSNLYLSAIKISAKQIDPLTGLLRIGQQHGSFIYASPKQRMKMVPVANNNIPHAVMTTGAITEPNYKTSRFMSARTAYISHADHIMGAIVVEIENKEFFHFRQIQANESGAFTDLDKRYDGTKITKNIPEAFILGDWHSGDTNGEAKRAWEDVVKQLKPRMLVLHDVFDGKSINRFDENKHITKALKVEGMRDNLKVELAVLGKDLDELSAWAPKTIVVKSNHDEFLERYLDEVKFKYDTTNFDIALELANEMMKGKDPVKYGAEKLGIMKRKKKIRWLKRDESFKVAGVELGVHGDRGANGSRGNITSMEIAYGSSVTGHTHSPEILRSAYRVGTSTHLSLDYNKGPSSWCYTSCLVHKDGSKQLINCINDNWRV